MKSSVFVMFIHTKRCANFGWSGRGTYDQLQNRWISRESLMKDVPSLVWVFELNLSNFTPRVQHKKRASVVRRSVLVVPTEPNLVVSSVVGTVSATTL